MTHDELKRDKTLDQRTQEHYMYHHLRSVFKRQAPSDDLMGQAEKRRTVKRAAERAKGFYEGHKVLIWVVEAVFVVMTLGGYSLLRRRNKKS